MSRPLSHVDFPQSVLRVMAPGGRCAGVAFPINSAGLLLTCAHVVDDASAGPGQTIALEDQSVLPPVRLNAQVKKDCWSSRNDGQDVALLQIDAEDMHKTKGFKVLPLRTAKPMTTREVVAWGFPLEGIPGGTSGRGIIQAKTHDGRKEILEIGESNELSKGFSGAPVVDEELGLIVGMIQKGVEARRLAFALPVDELLAHCKCLQGPEAAPYVGLRSFGSEGEREKAPKKHRPRGRTWVWASALVAILGGVTFWLVLRWFFPNSGAEAPTQVPVAPSTLQTTPARELKGPAPQTPDLFDIRPTKGMRNAGTGRGVPPFKDDGLSNESD